MQADLKEISKLTAAKTKRSEQLYKDVGNFVFASLYTHMRKPSTLIAKVRGIGSWYLRRNRMRIIIENFPLDMEKTLENAASIFKYENKKELRQIFKDRLKDYEEYIKLRDEIRKQRHVTQKLLTSEPQSKD